jgi:hypothetical protein
MAEVLKIPSQVVDADWRNDVGDYETYGTETEEMEYVSPDEVNKESIEKIKARNLSRGRTVLGIFNKNLAA